MLRPDCILFIHFGTAAAYINLDPVAGERKEKEEDGRSGQHARHSEQMKRKLLRPLLMLVGMFKGSI